MLYIILGDGMAVLYISIGSAAAAIIVGLLAAYTIRRIKRKFINSYEIAAQHPNSGSSYIHMPLLYSYSSTTTMNTTIESIPDSEQDFIGEAENDNSQPLMTLDD